MGERFVITVEAVPGWTTPGIIRLRRLLKTMLRAFGLRCVGLSGADDVKPVQEMSE